MVNNPDSTATDDVRGSVNSLFDSMQKILNKSISSASAPILAKQKSIEQRIEDEKLLVRARKLAAMEKKERQDRDHVLPDITKDIELEKRLRRTATKGVVKLFNAIEHGLKASAASAKRPGFSLEKDLAIKKTKKAFVDYLVGTTAATPPTLSTAETSVENNQMQPKANNAKPVPSNWSVIKEDYLLNESSLKNWDVEEE